MGTYRNLLVVGLAIWYSFVADRGWFDKVQKQFDWGIFSILSFSTVVIGVLSIRPHEDSFLARDQTDEWKGWMQCIILIYHYTAASKVLPIYQFIRLLVASYLFMTGFGHTVFFYSQQDYSLRRVASTIIRLNLLNCFLPVVMGTDYMFYYFAPLVTFWFLVVYMTMRVFGNSFLTTKILASVVVTTFVTRCPGLLEAVFLALERLSIRWDVDEWRFRVALDMHIVHVGMLAAVAYVRFRNHLDLTPRLHQLCIATCLLTLPLYWWFASTWTDKYAFNRWHPYLSPFPILAFVVLRNSTSRLRSFHSSTWAWVGRCSLETFTLQFHMWLAADTKGLLSTGLLGRVGDFVVLTSIFMWLSWHVAKATSIIAKAFTT